MSSNGAPPHSRLWLIGGAVALAALVVASIVVALLQSEATFPEGSPERAVQAYIEALQQDDLGLVYSFLATSLKEDCAIDDVFGSPSRFRTDVSQEQVTLRNTEITEDGVAFVTVRVTEFRRNGPFGTSESDFERTYTLRREGSEWRFTRFPWPSFGCPKAAIDDRTPAIPEPKTREQAATPIPTSSATQ